MAILPQPGIITLPILLLSKLDRFTSSMAMGGHSQSRIVLRL